MPRLADLDLNLLHTFSKVVDCGGVLAASRELGRTQPAVTARIRKLESELGVPLFERAGRGIELTSAGRAIERETRVVLAGLQRVADQALRAQSEPVGNLRLGALPTVATYLLAEPIAAFTAAHSEVAIEMQLGLVGTAIDQLQSGALDLVVAVGPPPEANDLDVARLGEVRPTLCMRGARRKRRSLPVHELARLSYIGYPRVSDLFFEEVRRFLDKHRISSSSRVSVLSIETIKRLVLAEAGVSILPDYSIVEPGLIGQPVRGLDFVHPLWCASRASAASVPLVREFVAVLRAKALRR